MAVCVAVIGKENAPLYLLTADPAAELQFHYTVHTALDVVEEKLAATGKTAADSRELYLGALYSTEEHRVFGYATNTKIKFIIVVEAANVSIRDNEIRTMFRRLHAAYTDMVCNPFYLPARPITARAFDRTVRQMVTGAS
ncbi:Trafficking protein particle complex subunit 2-like protein [Amphibalanus amphitrite]|uniref:Trafficking protein particle complex subunit 2-like protein n=1 Tax=Amphibalanus amphitrite TaxID=1232801 RepID=A0A6A4WK23_AMPAM|nr:trafficking protein particle complex subunit 2-like protein [Amphibalanus amphitrite]XP_043231244.1 trafficking protein particle complex subunit 2-like protein [Amphibalanus amphitrite]XP_043231245.1 trafficking protein particle complex subunit 2-like protein [Amphibalanus amphitrite]KAF0302528.1 Trafficking protein particle complex subunit 2-like protein [Amphibalanus amphitrite]